MKPVVLFRAEHDNEVEEMKIAAKYFKTVTLRSAVPTCSLVIGRYSVLPFYNELANDLLLNDCELINTMRMHSYVADVSQWYHDLKSLTPHTWFSMIDVPKDAGPFVLKGMTNSRKDRWKTKMYAENWEAAMHVWSELMDDPLISQQGVCIREYVPLHTYPVENLTGSPVTEEYRCFFYRDQLLAGGYYWSTHSEELKELGMYPEFKPPLDFLRSVLDKLGYHRPKFLVIDVARTSIGSWIVVELNDGQMSGLSDVDPDALYHNLHEALHEDDYG